MAVTLFTALGNAQDDAAPDSASAPSPGSAARGNVAMSKARHEVDLQRAALTSREQKALKEAMAAYAPKPAPITTAEQFLAANRPPAAPPREGDSAFSRVRTSTEVPEFLPTPGRVKTPAGRDSARTTRAAALPGGKPGWFDLFKSKKGSAPVTDVATDPSAREASAPPAADYPPPVSDLTPVTEPDATTVPTASASSPEPKPDFLSRLFGKGKKPEAASLTGPGDEGTAVPAPGQPSVPSSGRSDGSPEEETPVPPTASEN